MDSTRLDVRDNTPKITTDPNNPAIAIFPLRGLYPDMALGIGIPMGKVVENDSIAYANDILWNDAAYWVDEDSMHTMSVAELDAYGEFIDSWKRARGKLSDSMTPEVAEIFGPLVENDAVFDHVRRGMWRFRKLPLTVIDSVHIGNVCQSQDTTCEPEKDAEAILRSMQTTDVPPPPTTPKPAFVEYHLRMPAENDKACTFPTADGREREDERSEEDDCVEAAL